MAISIKDARATQDFVPIEEVRDGIVILKDGSMRAIVMTSSLNFALKGADEQEAILSQFQNFLNSLEFPVQIFIQSRDLDIRPYIALLEERYKAQTNDLMQIQTREYIEFVKKFVEDTNIMSKHFFIVIPYSASVVQAKKGLFSLLELVEKKGEGKKTKSEAKAVAFEKSRSQIEQRVSVVEQGLARTGIRVVSLGTEEIIELFYRLFNPGELSKPIPLEK
ncbi:hypothetical protein IIB51_01020 [Patescibacteria group bacterium]|nr:hypothetical protein [Patescibacteria group bacterium]MCH8888962.1 hypothetical protein [Patescibacteria group bacterium]